MLCCAVGGLSCTLGVCVVVLCCRWVKPGHCTTWAMCGMPKANRWAALATRTLENSPLRSKTVCRKPLSSTSELCHSITQTPAFNCTDSDREKYSLACTDTARQTYNVQTLFENTYILQPERLATCLDLYLNQWSREHCIPSYMTALTAFNILLHCAFCVCDLSCCFSYEF